MDRMDGPDGRIDGMGRWMVAGVSNPGSWGVKPVDCTELGCQTQVVGVSNPWIVQSWGVKPRYPLGTSSNESDHSMLRAKHPLRNTHIPHRMRVMRNRRQPANRQCKGRP